VGIAVVSVPRLRRDSISYFRDDRPCIGEVDRRGCATRVVGQQDARNVGLGRETKAETISNCNAPGGKCVDSAPRQLDCPAPCNGTCPDEPNGSAGAPTPPPPRICGDDGLRACCALEGFPCLPGLEPQGRVDSNVSARSALESLSICKVIQPCDGDGQRACSAREGRNCQPGLVEQGSCDAKLGFLHLSRRRSIHWRLRLWARRRDPATTCRTAPRNVNGDLSASRCWLPRPLLPAPTT
jgi:hypothetical protein